jgi:hypothetical protein
MQAFLFYCLTPFKGKVLRDFFTEVPRDFFTAVFRPFCFCIQYVHLRNPPSHPPPCNPFCFTASRPLKGKSREIPVIYLRVSCLRICFAYRTRLPLVFKLCSLFFSISFYQRHYICSAALRPLVNSLFSFLNSSFSSLLFWLQLFFLYLCHFYVDFFCKKCCHMSPLHLCINCHIVYCTLYNSIHSDAMQI